MAKPRLAPFEDIELVLTNLLKQFAKRGRSDAAETFWRLQEDGIWEVRAAAGTLAAWNTRRPTSRSLIVARATGGLSESLDATLRQDATLALRVMSELLDRNFSSTARDAVAAALEVSRHPVRPEIVDPNVLIHYSPRALKDITVVLGEGEDAISTEDAINRMKGINTGPWRTILGTGLVPESLWALLAPFGIAPQSIVPLDGAGIPRSGYTCAALDRGTQVPLATWVTNTGHRPAVPEKARRIRDIPVRPSNDRLRRVIESSGWAPYVLCDASGCYWNGAATLPTEDPRHPPSVGGPAQRELLTMCASGYFGDWMKDVFIDESRFDHIYEHLVEYPLDAMIFRDSLHHPGELTKNASAQGGPLDPDPDVAISVVNRRHLGRLFDPTRIVESFVVNDPRSSAEEIAKLQEQATRGHHEILALLHKYLADSGWVDIEEIPGAIDLWAISPSKTRVIFEAKTITESNEIDQCRAALAQLLEYRFFFGRPTDQLCLIVDRQTGSSRVAFLESAPIAVVAVNDRGVRGVGARGNHMLADGSFE